MSSEPPPSKPPPSTVPPVKSPEPPRTKSGELFAVRTFVKAVEKYNDETVPILDEQVDRMEELRKKVTVAPVEEDTEDNRDTPPIPRAPSVPDVEDE